MDKSETYVLVKPSLLETVLTRLENIEKTLTGRSAVNTTEVFSEQEACKFLHLSLKTLQNLRKRGHIRFTRPPGNARRVIYTKHQLEDFLCKNEFNSGSRYSKYTTNRYRKDISKHT